MTRSELEKYLGKSVCVKLFDGDMYNGILHKTGEEMYADNPNLYIPRNWYFIADSNNELVSCIFRTTHVISLKVESEKYRDDREFLSHIIDEICTYAAENDMDKNETLKTVANNILFITEIATFDKYKSGKDDENNGRNKK